MADLHGGEVEWAVSEAFGIPVEKITSFANTVSPILPKEIRQLARRLSQLYMYPPHDPVHGKQVVASRQGVAGPDQVLLGSGSTELIYLFARRYGRPGAIIPIPTYSEYETAVVGVGGQPWFVPLTPEFDLDVDAIARAWTPECRSVFLCAPNNPTGRLYSPRTIEAVAEIARDRGGVVLVDEAYMCFAPVEKRYTSARWVGELPVITLNSLSKLYGVPSLRLGWAVGEPRRIRELERDKFPGTVSNLALWALDDLAAASEFEQRLGLMIARERSRMVRRLSSFKELRVVPSDSNFLLCRITELGLSASQLFERLARRGLVVRDLSRARGLGPEWFRVTVRTPGDNDRLIRELRGGALQS